MTSTILQISPCNDLFAEFLQPCPEGSLTGCRKRTVKLYGMALVKSDTKQWMEGIMLDQETHGHRFTLVEGETGFITYSNGKFPDDGWGNEVGAFYRNNPTRGGVSSIPIPTHDIRIGIKYRNRKDPNTYTEIGEEFTDYDPRIHSVGKHLTWKNQTWEIKNPCQLGRFMGVVAELKK